MSEPVTARRAFRDVAVQLLGYVVNLAMGVGVTVLIAHLLGPAGNGQWATILAVTQIALLTAEMGLETTTLRLAAPDRANEASWLGALLVTRLVIALPAALVAGGVVVLVATGDGMVAAGLLATAIIVVGAPGSLRVAYRLRTRNDIPTALLTVNSALWLGAVAIVAALDGGVVAVAACLLATTAVTAAFQAAFSLRIQRLRFDDIRSRVRRLARVAIPVGIGGVVTVAYAKVDQILVLEYAGASDAGQYGAAYMLLDRGQVLPGAVMTTVFPIVAAAWPLDPDRVRRVCQLALELLALVAFPVLAFSLVASDQLTTTLYGDAYADAANALPILMAAFVLVCLGYLLGFLAVTLDGQRRLLVIALIALALNIAANIVVIPAHGFVGAAWVTLATELVVQAAIAAWVLPRLQWHPQLRRLLGAAGCAAVMAAAVAATAAAIDNAVVLLAIGGTVYVVALFGARVVDRDELSALRG